jgi:uncharacterized protein (TIGR02284 family)
MNKEKNLSLLNSLIEINCERIAGYHLAISESNEPEIKELFYELAETSELCRSELTQEILQLGSLPRTGILVTGKFHKLKRDLKKELVDDTISVLNSCKRAEDIIVNRYKQALRNNLDHMTAEQQNMLNMHYALLRHDRSKITSLVEPALVA